MEKDDLIAVIGAGGVLGNGILKALAAGGYTNVIAPPRSELDCSSLQLVDAWFSEKRPKYVFHLASLVYGLKGNLNNQLKSLVENTEIASNVIVSAEKYKISKIFYSGTVASYPYPYQSMPLSEDQFWQGLPHAGEYGYAMAKRHAFAYLEVLRKNSGIDFCYGIFTNLYGINDRFDTEQGHVIPSLIAKAVSAKSFRKGVLKVWGRPETTRDFLFGDDAGEAAVLAMNLYDGMINISSGKETRMDQVAAAIAESVGGLSIEWDENAPVGIPNRVVCNERLKALGFNEKNDLLSGIKATVSWYEKNKGSVRA